MQQAALHCFVKLGYHQTRIEDIIARAKTGKGTFYIYFKSKEEVVHSLIDDFAGRFEQIHQWVFQSLSKSGETSDLHQLFTEEGTILTKLLEENREVALFLHKEAHAISDEVHARFGSFYSQQIQRAVTSYTKALDMGLMKGIDPRFAAYCVVGGVSFIYFQWLEGKITDPLPDILQKTLDFYLQALSVG